MLRFLIVQSQKTSIQKLQEVSEMQDELKVVSSSPYNFYKNVNVEHMPRW